MTTDKIEDGGPAFSQPAGLRVKGMTLLDYFAGQTLAGYCSNPEMLKATVEECTEKELNVCSFIAATCYGQAVAMIAQRKEPS